MSIFGMALDLSFDHPTGYYLYCDGQPSEGGLIHSADGHSIDGMVDAVSALTLDIHNRVGLTWLAVEDVYLAIYRSRGGGASRQNVDVLIHLVDLRAPILTDARRNGIEYRFLGKSYEIDEACNIQHFLKRPQRKAAMARLAKALTGLELPEDVNDACCVGFWGNTEHNKIQWGAQ